MNRRTTIERARARLFRTVLLGASVLGAPAAFAQTAPIQQPGSPAQSSTTVEELVVTASKRAQTIQNTPTAVTAITSAKIDALGIKDFADYMQFVPSLEMEDDGGPGQGVIIIRGVYSGYEQTTTTVGVYIDETPFTASSASAVSSLVMPDPDLSDVDRVEVLKGPQSTLYGASALGGLIRIITKKPDSTEFSADLSAGGAFVDGGGDGYNVRGSVNLPVVTDKLAIRLSAFDRLDPGYVDNVQTGQDNVNTTRVEGGHLAVLFTPTDRFDIELNGFLQEMHNYGTAGNDLDPTTLQPLEGRYDYTGYFNSNIYTEYVVGNVTANYRLDAGTITEAASYAHYRSNEFLDYSKLYGPLFGFTPPEATLGDLIPALNKFTEELRFNSNRIGPLELQGGFFYTHETPTYDAILYGVNGKTGALLPAPFGNLINAVTLATYDEYAVYADATLHFNDRLDATAGVRESHNDQHADSITAPGGLLAPASNDLSQSSASDTSYLLTVRWRPTDDLSTYARIASAYRPGGPQFSPSPEVPPSFGPDTVWNYEVGAKGVWFGGRLSADADVYYLVWRDIQLNSLVEGLTTTGNGGNAHSDGVEVQGQFKPFDHLVIGANGAYDQTRMDYVNTATVAANAEGVGPGAVVGDPLPNVPKWSGALTADYSFPILNATGTLGVTYRYQGSEASSFSGLNSDIDAKIPAYSVVDLRARLDWKRYSVTFRIDNVANTYALNNIELIQLVPGDPFDPVVGSGVPIQPRTYRISLEARF